MIIEAIDVSYEYPGKRALKNVSFGIEAGSITALVGRNGAGKTTLQRCIAALDDPFSGTIRVSGIDTLQHPREVHSKVGYLSDFFGLYNGLTLRQSLTYVAGLYSLDPATLDSEIESLAHRLGLSAKLDTQVAAMSRGQRQRAGIAQAIIHKPDLLLLDEPAAGLDPEARVGLSALFLSLRDAGMTLVVSSHILSELEDYCTHMLYLQDGQVIDHRSASVSEQQTRLVIALSEQPQEKHTELLAQQPMVSDVTADAQGLTCMFAGDKTARAELLRQLVKAKLPVCGMEVHKKRLQDVYMEFVEGEHHAADA